MFNKTYQSRAVRKAVIQALPRLPEPWRPLVVVAAAAEEVFYRPQRRVPAGIAGKRRKKGSPSLQRELNFARDPDRPLFDLFPEAYQ